MESSSRRRMDEPHQLGSVISQLMALRGYGRRQTELQLQEVWQQIAGAAIARQTKVLAIKNGTLQIAVTNSSLLQQLEGFHKHSLLERLANEHGDLRIRALRFRLKSVRID